MSKQHLIDDLYNKYRVEFSKQEIVLGEGNLDTDILLIGEAPGKDEVRLSKPFVGMAGKNLTEFLGVIGLDRQSIYITNAIKFRLSKLNEKTGRLSNRPATAEEMQQNVPYLNKEIQIINPKYIVTLGNVPLRAVLGSNRVNIGDVHGRIMSERVAEVEYNLFPLYHPASIIYNKSLKGTYINDIKKLSVLCNR